MGGAAPTSSIVSVYQCLMKACTAEGREAEACDGLVISFDTSPCVSTFPFGRDACNLQPFGAQFLERKRYHLESTL